MAEKIVSDIKTDFLTCSICNKVYNNPKALPCLHTFCRKCLEGHVDKHVITAKDGTTCVLCPTCLQICDLPKKGIDALQDNVMLRNLLDMIQTEVTQNCDVCRDEGKRVGATYVCIKCEEFLCNECSKNHKRTRVTRDHLVMKISSMRDMYQSSANKELVPKNIHVRKLAKFGHYSDELCDPISITTNKADDVIISNANNTISVFSLAGNCKKTINQNLFYGDAQNCRSNKCIAITMEGYVAVAMRKDITATQANVVTKQTFAAREVGICSVKTSSPKDCEPHGIAVTSNNHVVVSDANKHCLYVFNAENQLVTKEGKWGSRNYQFKYPYHIAVNSANDVLVSDYGNHCIKVFAGPKLKFRFKFGGMGASEGQFLHPTGICTDRYGNIFICDRDNHRVQMFNDVGKFTSVLIRNTCLDGLDVRPQDVAMTTSGHLLVLLRGVEGVDFAQVNIYQYTTVEGKYKFDQSETQQLYALRESLDSISLKTAASQPARGRRGALPPLDHQSGTQGMAAIGHNRRLEPIPSAPNLHTLHKQQPDLLAHRSNSVDGMCHSCAGKRESPSAVCAIL